MQARGNVKINGMPVEQYAQVRCEKRRRRRWESYQFRAPRIVRLASAEDFLKRSEVSEKAEKSQIVSVDDGSHQPPAHQYSHILSITVQTTQQSFDPPSTQTNHIHINHIHIKHGGKLNVKSGILSKHPGGSMHPYIEGSNSLGYIINLNDATWIAT
eukprot:Gregarina_sp_Pseudo_9__821@NODE_1525_length_1523_cov_420_103100_g1413_i0_p2_GENE_NODE_1525_length_1523_cov_420_103100_g1413_i0NODE_1525_length_1523_cov_420_103100_g1413_i0_p2_ORF_typecomplete_len157_score1_48PEHE/PF15275_6/0_033_NODE_1525_length_1523_cov_420_103100_g1413_i0300770